MYKVKMLINEEEDTIKTLFIEFFNLLNLNENIMIDIFRGINTDPLFKFCRKYDNFILHDIRNSYNCCVLIPYLDNAYQLMELMSNNDYPAEFTCIKPTCDFYTFLYNFNNVHNIELIEFKAVINHEGFTLYFNEKY